MNIMCRSTLLYIATICLLSTLVDVFAQENLTDGQCPDDNTAFITTCGGRDSEQEILGESADGSTEEETNTNGETSEDDATHHQGVPDPDEVNVFDDSHLVDEVIHESKREQSQQQQQQQQQQQHKESYTSNFDHNDKYEEIGVNAMQQLQHTFVKLTQRYYDPLPAKAKCAVGTICGFASSRIALGVANRLVRLTGAIWVASEVLHTSGFCDETKCVPEEMRPWIGIVRRALVKQCVRVRLMARKIYNQERIREIANKNSQFAGGFASGAFIGFVV
eukprot:scaffold342608_cov76-Cyclotella_meneghiniana.AAC.1